MAADLPGLLGDLAAESEDLDALVAGLPDEDWARPTPAAGWTIAHQIKHLAWTDDVALTAINEPARFAELLKSPDVLTAVERGADGSGERPAALLARWRTGRGELSRALEALPTGAKIAWFGPPMSAASMATARLMETWAHGQDVADALGATREPTVRLRHVAHIGIRARAYAYHVNGLTPPDEEFRIELTGPDGEQWEWGPADARQRVTGPALDFCLLATQRRHRSDLRVSASGDAAEQWLKIIQAFAGPPGPGRPPMEP